MADLLLVGRTGNGKSSTGNSILGKKAFQPRGGSYSATDDMSKSDALVDGKRVTVVDGPGLGDTGFDVPQEVEAAINMAKKALGFLAAGFHALLIVLKYGVRFTKQEKDAIKMIKSVYGEDVVKTHGVIVMTHGDSFDMDMEDERTTFETWCKQQTGDVQSLFRECSLRCVLFNNKTNDMGRLREQNNKLMSMVGSIQTRQRPYTMDDFRRAEPGRRKLTVESRVPQLRKETEDVLDRIEQEARKIEDRSYVGNDVRLQELEAVKRRLDEHKDHLQREDMGTGAMSQILVQVGVTESSIKTKIERYKRLIENEKLEQEIRRSRNDFQPRSRQSEGLPSAVSPALNETQKKIAIVMVAVVVILFLYYIFLSGNGDPDVVYGGPRDVDHTHPGQKISQGMDQANKFQERGRGMNDLNAD